jgi:hypothetical protein
MEWNADMPRSRHSDAPDYAVDLLDGAKPIGSQLSVATGILAALLVAMSAVETPMQPTDLVASDVGATEIREPSAPSPGPLCLIGTKVRNWIGVAAS